MATKELFRKDLFEVIRKVIAYQILSAILSGLEELFIVALKVFGTFQCLMEDIS
jgi:hypothetical protein